MADNKQDSTPGGSFLGGGPKFNQAGNNSPLSGEKLAPLTTKRLPFGGPRIWLGVLGVIALICILWFVYGGGLAGVNHVGGRGGVLPTDRPSDNPDQSGPGQ